VSDEVFMTWAKPKANDLDEGAGTKTIRIQQPHPSIIFDWIDVMPSDKVDSFVEEAVRFYSLMLCINGMPKDIAMKLAKPEHYTLHIDEDSDPNNYLLSVAEVTA